MVDALDRLTGTGGLPASQANPFKPWLEGLEDRTVPTLISGLYLNNAIYANVASTAPVVSAPFTQAAPVAQTAVASTAVASTGIAQVAREVNFAAARTNASRSEALALFNPSLGQLKSVSITAEGNLTSSVQMENLEATPTDMTAKLNGTLRFQVGNTVLQSSPSRILEATLGGFDGGFDLQGSSAKDFGLTKLDGTFNSVTLSDPADIASFIGTGTLGITQETTATSCACGSGNLMALVRSTTQGKVKVVYTYQPRVTPPPPAPITAPEPQGSKFFLISGLQWGGINW